MARGLTRRALCTTALVALALSAAGCATTLGTSFGSLDPTPAATPNRTHNQIRIAMLLSLSGFGPNAVLAKGLKQAGELALFEADHPLAQIIVKDDKGTPSGAAAAAAEAIAEGAEIIVGPMTAHATAAVAPLAAKARIPILSFSNDKRVAGKGVYVLATLPEQEIERIISYSAKAGRKRFAALIPNDDTSPILEQAFLTSVQRADRQAASVVRYPLDANTMITPLRQLADEFRQAEDSGQPIDTLFIAGNTESLSQMGPLMSYAGFNTAQIKVIGTSNWDYANAGRNPALANGWYPAPEPRYWQDFTQRFSRSFGSIPPHLAGLAYDAVTLAVTLSALEPAQRFTQESLTRAAGFPGVEGTFRLTSNGTTQRNLAVLELQTFASSVIDPAGGGDETAQPSPTGAAPRTPTQNPASAPATSPRIGSTASTGNPIPQPHPGAGSPPPFGTPPGQ